MDERGNRHVAWVKAKWTSVWIPRVDKNNKAPQQVGLEGMVSRNHICPLGPVDIKSLSQLRLVVS